MDATAAGHCRTVGAVRRRGTAVGLEWEIPDFFSLPDCVFYSPDFPCRGAHWYLILYPNGHQPHCEGWVVLLLCRRLGSPRGAVRFGLGIRRADGTGEDATGDLTLPEGCTHLRVNEFLLRSDLLRRRRQLAPSDSLTVTCTLYGDEAAPRVRDNVLTYRDDPKPTGVHFKFNEQMDEKATTGEHIISKEVVIENVSDDISRKKAKEKGVSNSMQRDIRRTVKCILKFVGNCVGRRY